MVQFPGWCVEFPKLNLLHFLQLETDGCNESNSDWKLLEQLLVPINYKDFNAEDSEVTVNLSVEDAGDWKPSKRQDRKWNVTNQLMTQVGIHSYDFVV